MTRMCTFFSGRFGRMNKVRRIGNNKIVFGYTVFTEFLESNMMYVDPFIPFAETNIFGGLLIGTELNINGVYSSLALLGEHDSNYTCSGTNIKNCFCLFRIHPGSY